MKNQLLPTHPIADGKSGEVLWEILKISKASQQNSIAALVWTTEVDGNLFKMWKHIQMAPYIHVSRHREIPN